MSVEAKASTHMKIHGRNYAIPKAFVEDEHPGGIDAILDNKNKDATEAYDDAGHSPETLEMMNEEYTTVPVIYEGTTYYVPVEWAVNSHPGGKMNILKFHGKDITADFKRIGHSEGAAKLLFKYTTRESARDANEAILAKAAAPAAPATPAPVADAKPTATPTAAAAAPAKDTGCGCPLNSCAFKSTVLIGLLIAGALLYKRIAKQ